MYVWQDDPPEGCTMAHGSGSQWVAALALPWLGRLACPVSQSGRKCEPFLPSSLLSLPWPLFLLYDLYGRLAQTGELPTGLLMTTSCITSRVPARILTCAQGCPASAGFTQSFSTSNWAIVYYSFAVCWATIKSMAPTFRIP